MAGRKIILCLKSFVFVKAGRHNPFIRCELRISGRALPKADPLGTEVPAMAKHLTLEERDARDRIAYLMLRGFRQAAIAEMLNRHPSVISRELKRNRSDGGQYYAAKAHHTSGQRRKERPQVR